MRELFLGRYEWAACVAGWIGFASGLGVGVAGTLPVLAADSSAGPPVTMQYRTNREVSLGFSAAAGAYCRIETATNVLQWAPLVTVQSTGSVQHVDTAAPYLETRYYRGVQLTGTNYLTGDHVPSEVGDIIVHPVNHASLVLQWSDQVLYSDPVGGAARYQGLPRATLILVTHGHQDHFDNATLDAVRAPGVQIFAPRAVYTNLTTTLKALTTLLTNGASASVAGVTIDAMPACNLTAAQHPRGVGNGYVLTVGGRRIYISGDTEDIQEMRDLVGIDVAFLAMNKPYTMSVDQAVSAVRRFQPRVVYPDHYTPSNPVTDLNAFKERVGQDLGIEVRLRKWY